jgi:hypothetical protein
MRCDSGDERNAANAFVKFIASPAAAVLKANGFEPG